MAKKIEVVKQQDLKDCGPCSLLSIIKYYGGYVPLEKIRDDTCTTSSGTTAYHLVNAAVAYGFDAMGVKVECIDDENIYLPAICHLKLKNGLEHFAVVYKVTSKYVYLMDPAHGKVKMDREKFNAIWDNILILLSPISEILKVDKEISIFDIFMNLIIKNKKIFCTICLINIFFMIITILSSFYFQVAVKSIEDGSDMFLTKFIILLFFLITVIKVVISFIKTYYMNYLNRNLDVEIFSNFLKHIFYLPLKFMQNRTTGEIVSRVEELSEIKNLLSEAFTTVILNSVLIMGSIIVLYFISDKLFFILCLIIIIYIIGGLIFSKMIYRRVKECILVGSNFNTTLVEHVEMNESIKNLNLEKSFLYKLEDKLILMFKSDFALKNLINNIEFIKNFIYEIGLFIITTLGIYLIYKGSLELLSLVTFNSIILYLFNPVKEIIDLIPEFNYLKASFNKISEFLNISEEKSNNGFARINKANINVQSVSYTYNKFTDILNDVSFKINNGSKVFLSGPSGSGKSTICNLLKNYQIDFKGKITIGDASKDDYDISALKNDILYVGQNERLFTGTIKENIVCYRDILDEEFLNVIKICKLEDTINKRPSRYNFIINAALNNLSGGERQRVILARALLKKARIIILDEALSEVNIEIEKEIIDNIKKNYESSTIIYVSHKDVEDKFEQVINVGEVNG